MANEVRLIDADALITAIQGTASKVAKNAPYDPEWLTRLAARQVEILFIIDDQPTVDAVEVVHGHWEDGWGEDYYGRIAYKSIDCSECHEIFKIESRDREYWKNRFKVCPFCGAKMDGDGNG